MPEIDETKIGLTGSPTRVKNTFTPERMANGVYITGNTAAEIAARLLDKLADAKAL